MADEKATQGQPFRPSARQWNEAVEAGEFYAKNRRLGEAGEKRAAKPDATKIKVRNGSGADRSLGDVLEVGDSLITELSNEYIWHDADTPTAEAGKVVGVLLEPIKSGEIGELLLVGACKATVSMQASGEKFCSVEASSHKLKSGPAGTFPILYAPTGTGDKECVVLLDRSGGTPFEIVHIKLTEVLHPGASALGRLVTWSEDDEAWNDPDEDADDVLLTDLPFMGTQKETDPDDYTVTETSVRAGWNFGLIDEVFQARAAPDFLLTDPEQDPPLESTYCTVGSWGLVRQALIKNQATPPTYTPLAIGATGTCSICVDRLELDPVVEVQAEYAWNIGNAPAINTECTIEYMRESGRWQIRPIADWPAYHVEYGVPGTSGDIALTDTTTPSSAIEGNPIGIVFPYTRSNPFLNEANSDELEFLRDVNVMMIAEVAVDAVNGGSGSAKFSSHWLRIGWGPYRALCHGILKWDYDTVYDKNSPYASIGYTGTSGRRVGTFVHYYQAEAGDTMELTIIRDSNGPSGPSSVTYNPIVRLLVIEVPATSNSTIY